MARAKPSLDSPSAKLLAALAEVARAHAVSVSDLADRLGLPVATAHRTCSELERLGYLQRVPGSRLWTVAHRLVALAGDTLGAAARTLAADSALRELSEAVHEVSSFAVPSGEHVLYLASVESPHELTLSFRAGRKAPLFCTSSGRLFLARLDEATLLEYLRSARRPAFTRHTVTDPDALAGIVRRVRKQGFAITDQEYVPHIVGAAVPVTGGQGTFYGAVSIAAPDVRAGKARMRAYLPALRKAARRLADAFEATATSAPAPSTTRLIAKRRKGTSTGLRRHDEHGG